MEIHSNFEYEIPGVGTLCRYVVFEGSHTGVYDSWALAHRYSSGQSGSCVKKFRNAPEAHEAKTVQDASAWRTAAWATAAWAPGSYQRQSLIQMKFTMPCCTMHVFKCVKAMKWLPCSGMLWPKPLINMTETNYRTVSCS